jgi:hypothetical protein
VELSRNCMTCLTAILADCAETNLQNKNTNNRDKNIEFELKWNLSFFIDSST